MCNMYSIKPGSSHAAARVLLVEDEPLIRLTMAEVLKDEGFAVVVAPDADAAWKLMQGDGFDLLLSDVHMPGRMTGQQLARRAHIGDPDLPVVFVSGRADLVEPLGPHEVFFAKPYGLNRVIDAMRALLAERAASAAPPRPGMLKPV